MANKLYVGVKLTPNWKQQRSVFRAKSDPTQETHGEQYDYVIGPFRTVLAAKLMAQYGESNPHMQCVADCERIARHNPNGL